MGAGAAARRPPRRRRRAAAFRLCSEAIPQQSRTSIVHGDYRIDNTILDADDPTQVRAVVDWELSTLGDPLSDAALMCVYRDPVAGSDHQRAGRLDVAAAADGRRTR